MSGIFNPFANKSTGGAANPFAGKPNPFAGKPNPFAPTPVKEETAPVEDVKEEKAIDEPIVKPAEEAVKEDKPAEKKIETPLMSKSNPFIKKASSEVAEEISPAIEKVEEKIEEPKTTEKEVEENEKIQEETPKAEDKPKKATPKRKPAKKKTSEDNTSTAETITMPDVTPVENVVAMPNTSMNFADAINEVKTTFVDDSWENIVAETSANLEEVIISSDMNAAGVKVALDRLSQLRQSIWKIHNEHKTLFESLTLKEPMGLIERVKIAGTTGSNSDERKQSGLRAVCNYKKGNEVINLLELSDEVRSRHNYLNSLMSSIQYKSSVLITMLGALNKEK